MLSCHMTYSHLPKELPYRNNCYSHLFGQKSSYIEPCLY